MVMQIMQGAPSVHTCTPRLAMKSTSSQILGSGYFEGAAHTESLPQHHHHHPQLTSSGFSDGSSVDFASVDFASIESHIAEDHTQPIPLGDGHCKLSSQNFCNPTLVEGERKQGVDGDECAFGMTVKQDGSIERDECALDMKVKQDDIENTFDTEKQTDEYATEPCVYDDNQAVKAHVDVNACISQMDKLSANAREAQETHEGPGEVTPPTGLNDDVLNLSNEKKSEEQSSATPPPHKPTAWRTPEPKARRVPEPEFIMEASSWPTLEEARHTKPSETRTSLPLKEKISVSSPSQKVLLSQGNSMEAPKLLNSNPPHPGSKYRSSYKKGSVPGSGKPSFRATENIPVPPMGVHVPNVNMFNPDQSMKGNGRAGMNNFFPGPHQAPANGPFYHHRGGGLAPFPHNSAVMPPYGRGHTGWQHHGRGYSDANYKQFGFSPVYDQQHIGPRHMHPPMAPFMNNAAHYNYPNFPGGMSYMPSAFSPGYDYATPYFVPSGHPRGAMQGFAAPTLPAVLRRQIEYYFSKENLIDDIYLISQMDEEGFVPLSVIAKFKRVESLTSDSMLILESLKNSSIVEVKNGKLRSREWRRRLSGTSQTHGVENLESFAPLSNTGVDHPRA